MWKVVYSCNIKCLMVNIWIKMLLEYYLEYIIFNYSYCRDQRDAADIIFITPRRSSVNHQIRNTYLPRTYHGSTTSNRKHFKTMSIKESQSEIG